MPIRWRWRSTPAGGDTLVVIVGLPDAAVKESRDRVSTALSNSGFKFPMGRTTINLAPADVKKEGPSFDLPIAQVPSHASRWDGLGSIYGIGDDRVRVCAGGLQLHQHGAGRELREDRGGAD